MQALKRFLPGTIQKVHLVPTARLLRSQLPPSGHFLSATCQRRQARVMASSTKSPPYPEQKQPGHEPGEEKQMDPRPDFGEKTYKGNNKLKGKVALVTGADSGIGRAIALAYAREGADVAISYYKEDADAQETKGWIEDAGRKTLLLPGDLETEEQCQYLIAETLKTFGKLDILVNNASMQEDAMESFVDIPRERLEKTFRVNIMAMFSLLQKATKQMLSQGTGGSIINVASIQAYKPSPPILDYACTKGAIVTLTKGAATELASKGIRVNCIAPGPVWTPLVVSSFPTEKTSQFGKGSNPQDRPGMPSEFQGPAVFLACDADSSFMTGGVLNLTGGNVMIA